MPRAHRPNRSIEGSQAVEPIVLNTLREYGARTGAELTAEGDLT